MYDPGESDQTLYPGNVHCKHLFNKTIIVQVHTAKYIMVKVTFLQENALKYDVIMCFND